MTSLLNHCHGEKRLDEIQQQKIKMIMSEQQNNCPRQAAVNALINWAKTGWGYYSMRGAVDNYLESCGVNRPSIGGEETILAHRKIAANRLAIDCIYVLSKEELSKVDMALEGIVSNIIVATNKLHR